MAGIYTLLLFCQFLEYCLIKWKAQRVKDLWFNAVIWTNKNDWLIWWQFYTWEGRGALAYLSVTYILAFWQFQLFQLGTPSSKCVHSLPPLVDVSLVHQIAASTVSSKFRRSQSFFWLSVIVYEVCCKLLIINQLNGKKGKTRSHKDLWGLPQNCVDTLSEEQVSLTDIL